MTDKAEPTPLTVKALEELLSKCTPGPWWRESDDTVRTDSDGNVRYDLPRIVRHGEHGISICKCHLMGGNDPDQAIFNAQLVSMAPAMAQEIIRLQKLLNCESVHEELVGEMET